MFWRNVGQTGACIVYTPERGITLDMLRNDVKYLKKRYSLDIKGKNEGRIVLKYVPPYFVYYAILLISYHHFFQKWNCLRSLLPWSDHQDVQRRGR